MMQLELYRSLWASPGRSAAQIAEEAAAEGFTGLEFLGLSDPASLSHDHEAEAQAALRAEALAERRLRRRIRTSAKTALAEGILNGSFTRYLNGD